MKISSFKKASFRRAILPASIIAAMAMSGSASAFKIDSDNPDLDIRWDNSFRYNAGWRAQEATYYQAGSAMVGPSEQKFGSGDMVTNRIDLLSEFDFIYKKDTGFRVSGAAWYDTVYKNAPRKDNAGGLFAGMYFPGGDYNDETSRYYNGPSAEFLDAFVFTKFDLGDVPVNVKLGQHTIYWGETIFSLAAGVSHGQSYADLRKALATPGAEAKEIFKPLSQFSFSAQISPEFTVMGQYFFDHKIDLFPLGGTFYSPVDFLSYSGSVATPVLFPLPLPWTGKQQAHEKSGDWGLAAKWRPEWLDGTAGFYYREFTPKNSGALALNMGGAIPLPGVLPVGAGIFLDSAAPRTKLTGFSLAKQVWGISWGLDLTHRKDATLQTTTFFPVNAAIGVPGAVGAASGWAPIGDLYTGTFNMIAYDGKRDVFGLPLYDSAVLTAEMDYVGVDKVTKNPLNWNSGANCAVPVPGIRANGGCVTGEAYGINFLFEPKWFQVWPGTDVTMPIFYGVGLKGNSAVAAVGQNEHQGAYSVGVTADVDAKYNFALKYNGFIYKHLSSIPVGPGVSNAALGDFSHKSTITFTAKATW